MKNLFLMIFYLPKNIKIFCNFKLITIFVKYKIKSWIFYIEDVDFSGYFSHPQNNAFDKYIISFPRLFHCFGTK